MEERKESAKREGCDPANIVFIPEEKVPEEEIEQKKIDILRFCRDEVRHEFSLLGARMTWYVTCQSFLITASAILVNNSTFKIFPWLNLCIAILGILISCLTLYPVKAAHDTIKMWLEKQRSLFPDDPPTLSDDWKLVNQYAIRRDYLSVKCDPQHTRSLHFSKFSPWIFIALWLISIALGLQLHSLQSR